jgi:hypothetical protein
VNYPVERSLPALNRNRFYSVRRVVQNVISDRYCGAARAEVGPSSQIVATGLTFCFVSAPTESQATRARIYMTRRHRGGQNSATVTVLQTDISGHYYADISFAVLCLAGHCANK